MTNKDLANLIFKDLKLTHDDCLKKYPKRNLPDNAVVTRYAQIGRASCRERV